MHNHWGRTSIYRPLSYPFRLLKSFTKQIDLKRFTKLSPGHVGQERPQGVEQHGVEHKHLHQVHLLRHWQGYPRIHGSGMVIFIIE